MLTQTLKTLHSVFTQKTGQTDLKYQPCERLLYQFHTEGFTAEDLLCVLTFMLWQNSKREPKYRDRMQFHRILGDLEIFNSRLGEARAWERNLEKKRTDRDKVLEMSGRSAEKPEARPRHIADVIKSIV